MLISRVLTKRAKNAYCFVQVSRRCLASQQQQAKLKTEVADFKKEKLPAPLPKKPSREPFAKNLFLGKFDTEFLAYPEPQTPDRWNEFQEWIMPLQEYVKTINPREFEVSNKIPPHVLQNLREMGIFGARIPSDYNGDNLLQSEFMQVLETVGKIPALGFFLLKQGVPAVDLLTNFGTVEQKFKYLPKIASGQSMATIALSEPNTGPMASNMEAVAILSPDEKHWLLDGEKTFVANSDLADTFLVFAYGMQSGNVEKRSEIISSFIVDRDTEGLTVVDSPMETMGLKGFNAGKIVLKNVKIPKENIIGEVGDGGKQIIDMFTGSRHFVAALVIPLLKNFVDLLTMDSIHRKYFEKPLHETSCAQTTITNLNFTIYSIESILYLTTGIMDIYQDQDVMLEAALVEQFCVQQCLKILQESMWLVGPKVCTSLAPYEQILRDAFTLVNFETQLFDTKIFAGLLGVTHLGKVTASEIRKIRNPMMYPSYLFKKMFLDNSPKLHLDEYLHQSLRPSAKCLDVCVYKLKLCTEQLLIRYGLETNEQHGDLQRLGDMVSYIYTLVGILARASRSYCIGNRHSELEIPMSQIIAHRYHQEILKIADDMDKGRYINGDHASQELSHKNFENKQYYVAHPLQRNY